MYEIILDVCKTLQQEVSGAYLSCFLVARNPPPPPPPPPPAPGAEGEGLIEPRPRVINTANASHFSIVQQPVVNEAFFVLLDSFLYPSRPKPCPCMSLVSYSFHLRMVFANQWAWFCKISPRGIFCYYKKPPYQNPGYAPESCESK